jgi:hypothetical protein
MKRIAMRRCLHESESHEEMQKWLKKAAPGSRGGGIKRLR